MLEIPKKWPKWRMCYLYGKLFGAAFVTSSGSSKNHSESSTSKCTQAQPHCGLFISYECLHILNTAKSCYPDLDTKSLNKFTCHSVRVGTCVTLHIGGANVHDIKHRLHWRSNSFMMYLRSMPQMTARHNSLFNQTDPDSINIPDKSL